MKFVPKLLTMEQKQLRLEIAQDMLDCVESDSNFLNTVITGDRVVGLQVRPRNKDAVLKMDTFIIPEAKERTAGPQQRQGFFDRVLDSRGVVHHEYAPQGQTITKEYYKGILGRLCNAVRSKRPDLWAAKTWQLHHDNAPTHSSHLIQGFLAKHNIPLIRQAPYSPDMAPCDFSLFPKLKMPLKETRFESREDIMRNATAQLYMIPQEAFQKCFQQ